MGTVLLWTAGAVLLFWVVGAHARLSRLRTAVAQTLGGVQLHWQQGLLLVRQYHEAVVQADATIAQSPAMHALQMAADQFAAALNHVQQQPLQRHALEQLAQARDAMQAAWDAALSHVDTSTAGVPAQPWRDQRATHLQQGEPVLQQYTTAVMAYHRAIAQFPASMLATLLGFSSTSVL